jgi:hypothetical protein
MLALKSAFHDEEQSLRLMEAVRWPDHVVCPCCGEASRIGRLGGSTTTTGSFKCYACRRRFSVRTGTVLEGSRIPLGRWLRVVFLLTGATRRVACKHVEEASSVAPRIARALRRKLLYLGSDLSGHPLSYPSMRILDWGCELATEEAAAFADLCRAVGVPGDTNGEAFIAAIERIFGLPAQAAQRLPEHAVPFGQQDLGRSQDWIFGPYERTKMAFDRL